MDLLYQKIIFIKFSQGEMSEVDHQQMFEGLLLLVSFVKEDGVF